MAKLKFDLLPGETVVGTYDTNYFLPKGQILMGKCTITDQRIVYHATADAVALQMSATIGVSAGRVGKNSWLFILKSEVKHLDVQKKFMRNRFMLTLTSGQVHVFGGGVFGGDVEKIVNAINIK